MYSIYCIAVILLVMLRCLQTLQLCLSFTGMMAVNGHALYTISVRFVTSAVQARDVS